MDTSDRAIKPLIKEDNTDVEEDPVLIVRQKSLNRMLASATRRHRRQRANTTGDKENENDRLPQPLSRQRSLTDLVSRWASSLRSSSSRSHRASKTEYSTKVEDYIVRRIIGSGATASVYSATHKPTDSLVAIKRVNLEILDTGTPAGSRLEALRKEIQIMTLCRHPHLLPVYQSFVCLSHLYIIMPIMSSGSCHDLLAQTRYQGLDETLCACILKQVVLGLDYLHGNGLVHRDVKSANLLLDRETGIVKLADFGVSNHLLVNNHHHDMPERYRPKLEPLRNNNNESSLSMHMVLPPPLAALPPETQVSCASSSTVGERSCHSSFGPIKNDAVRRSFVGTPCWMAPEILQDKQYNNKVDIWSLGVTAIELACGRPPYTEHGPLTIFTLILQDPSPTLASSGCRYDYSHSFEHFIGQCLLKNPAARCSASEALQHPFLRKAHSPAYLARYLAKHLARDPRRGGPDLPLPFEHRHAQGIMLYDDDSTWNFSMADHSINERDNASDEDTVDCDEIFSPLDDASCAEIPLSNYWPSLADADKTKHVEGSFQVIMTKVGQHMRPVI